MNKRELKILAEIKQHGGTYAVFWTPKTVESLLVKGMIHHATGKFGKSTFVAISDKGVKALKDM